MDYISTRVLESLRSNRKDLGQRAAEGGDRSPPGGVQGFLQPYLQVEGAGLGLVYPRGKYHAELATLGLIGKVHSDTAIKLILVIVQSASPPGHLTQPHHILIPKRNF